MRKGWFSGIFMTPCSAQELAGMTGRSSSEFSGCHLMFIKMSLMESSYASYHKSTQVAHSYFALLLWALTFARQFSSAHDKLRFCAESLRLSLFTV